MTATTQTGQPSKQTVRRANFHAIANERERESGTVGKQAGKPSPRPQPQINRAPAHPTPRGRGNNSSKQTDENRREGAGREK